MMKVCLILVAFACLAGVLNAQYCSNAYCPSGQCYQVVPGDTVGAIVGQNSYCVSQVGTANNINVNNIYPGEFLCIPSGCSVSSGRTYSTPTNYQACSTGVGCAGGTCYTVQSGNTVSGIVGGSISCINSVGK
jgi:LysM repeat protein